MYLLYWTRMTSCHPYSSCSKCFSRRLSLLPRRNSQETIILWIYPCWHRVNRNFPYPRQKTTKTACSKCKILLVLFLSNWKKPMFAHRLLLNPSLPINTITMTIRVHGTKLFTLEILIVHGFFTFTTIFKRIFLYGFKNGLIFLAQFKKFSQIQFKMVFLFFQVVSLKTILLLQTKCSNFLVLF